MMLWTELTEDQVTILQLLADGLTSRQIARTLDWKLTAPEVDRMINKLKDGLRCLNRVNLVARAIRNGVID